MLAAENGALAGAKVGGMGDVMRDLPRALVRRGHRVTVLMPSHGFLARLPGIRERGSFSVAFGGTTETCRWLELPSGTPGLEFQLLDHSRFAPFGSERIYHDDGASAPFATDANKYAFFCAAAASLMMSLERRPDVLHLHDWHLGLYLLLRECEPAFAPLRTIRTVFTIHNLAVQGIRPFVGKENSLASWFPELEYSHDVAADPRYTDCINPLAVAIRLADAVSTVSPTYAREIQEPADAASGRRGGESLEGLLAARHSGGALVGILNGCEYPATRQPRLTWSRLGALIHETLIDWVAAGTSVDSAAWLAERRLAALSATRPPVLATSVGRITEQKVGLLRQTLGSGDAVLDRVLAALGHGLLIVLGSGDPDHERFMRQAMARHSNLLFLQGYSEYLAEALYASGDLFLMPSVFEPCGISQMFAMRAGQPCVAHSVGGLRDTVDAGNGFPFEGATPVEQGENCARAVAAAVDLKRKAPARWRALTHAAGSTRFSWDDSASRYLREVYGIGADEGT